MPTGSSAIDHGTEPHHVPRFRSGFVRRGGLVERLINAKDAALALIVAPAGYGKSTLLSDWAEHDPRPFIWITTDERDCAAPALFRSIAQAFADIGWSEPDGREPELLAPGRGARSALARLMRALGDRDYSFVLVLDGADAVDGATLRVVTSALLEWLPPDAQLALASRTEPDLPIGRLRAHRALVEVRTADLMMDTVDADMLLRNVGLELDPDSLLALSQQTEGWPAGLYLAALSIREHEDGRLNAADFAGGGHLFSEYFQDEFLDSMPPESVEFMMRTSILDRLSGSVCDAVLGRTGSGVTLAALERLNGLLLPLDAGHEQYRWHHLFRDALLAGLRRTEPQLEPRLRRRASAWHERNGDVDRAIDHAVWARDSARAGELLWSNIPAYLMRGQDGQPQRWLERFSAEEIADHAPLALSAAYGALAAGQIDQAQHWRRAASDAQGRGRSAKPVQSLQTGIAVLEALDSDVIAMGVAARRVAGREPDHSIWRSVCCLLSGTADQLTGDPGAAKPQLEEGFRRSSPDAPIIAALCLVQLVMIAIDQGDWETAGEMADQAAAMIEQAGMDPSPTSAIVFAASAATCAHQGRTDEAKRDLRRAADRLAEFGDFTPWFGVETRLLLAHAALGLADTVAARTTLAGASRLARRAPEAIIFKERFDEAWAHIDTLAESALLGPSSLTIAELRILRFLPTHESFREIAQRLDVSVNTVKTQAHAIYRKLDAASRSEAVERARSAGLLGA